MKKSEKNKQSQSWNISGILPDILPLDSLEQTKPQDDIWSKSTSDSPELFLSV